MQNRVSAFSNLTSKSTRSLRSLHWKTVFQNILYLHADSCFLSKWCKLRLDTDECQKSDHRKKSTRFQQRFSQPRSLNWPKSTPSNRQFQLEISYWLSLCHRRFFGAFAAWTPNGGFICRLSGIFRLLRLNDCLHSPLRCPVLFSFIAFLNMRKLIRSCGFR